MLAGWSFDGGLLGSCGWSDGLKGVDREGVEEFMSYNEGCFVLACRNVKYGDNVIKREHYQKGRNVYSLSR